MAVDYYVYQLRLANNQDPFYVGKGHGSRMKHHFYPSNLAKNTHKSNVINKARRDGVEVLCEVIFTTQDESEAFTVEAETIQRYGRRDLGSGILTNRTNGGEGASGKKVSPETREKLALSRKGRKVSEEARENMRQAQRRMSAETKRKMSEAAKGKPKSDLWRQKNKEATIRRYMTKPSPLKGRKCSEEHKENIRKGLIAFRERTRNDNSDA